MLRWLGRMVDGIADALNPPPDVSVRPNPELRARSQELDDEAAAVEKQLAEENHKHEVATLSLTASVVRHASMEQAQQTMLRGLMKIQDRSRP
jgi:hypothetical protein